MRHRIPAGHAQGSIHEGEFHQRLQLQIQAAADGSIQGIASLPWGYGTRYRWMEHGDCIVILLRLPDSHGDFA